MRKYIVVDNSSSKVTQIMMWRDNRDFPTNIPLGDTEQVVAVDVEEDVELGDVYDNATKQFYILDITDRELEILDIKRRLSELELVLSDFQEITWEATVGFDEAKLPQIWQDRLNEKRVLRSRLNVITI